MMSTAFFPGPVFAWAFCLGLVGLITVAAYVDLRRLVIPKWLTLTMLGLGVLANLVRSTALAWMGLPGWAFAEPGWLGPLDGLLFSLAGFAIGFGLFFLLWLLGVCGGGDVKLFAALGAWVGPLLCVAVLGTTLVFVLALSLAGMVWRLLSGGMTAVRRASVQGRTPGKVNPRRRLLSYSLPVALATAVVLVWVFRVDLHLSSPKPDTDARAEIHAP
jgi:prepilin peptidase CpaA